MKHPMGIVEFARYRSELIQELERYPRVSQCFYCCHSFNERCLNLDFDSMPVIGYDECSHRKIVNCSEYKKKLRVIK